MRKFGNAVVKHRVLILVLALLLLIPSVLGMAATRINYDMLDYLPGDMETVQGQNILLEDFGKGAFSFVIVEGMPDRDVAALREKISGVDHVESAPRCCHRRLRSIFQRNRASPSHNCPW